jgi:hypothetical protein
MGTDFGVVYPLWADPQGPAKLLDRLLGEVGPQHLTIPVVTGRQAQFRLHPAQPPHYFATTGGCHFPPNPECYRSGPVRPSLAGWFGKRNVLARVCDYAAQRELRVIFRVDLRAVTDLPQRHEHLHVRNAWGDAVASAGLCVLSPDVRELLRAVLDDLLRYEFAGFQLVDWTPDLPVDFGEQRPLDWQPVVRQLMDICFCPACRQTATQAGVDPEQAARSVRVHGERIATQPDDDKLAAKARADEVLEAYLHARQRDALAWLTRLASTYPNRQRQLLGDLSTCQSFNTLLSDDAFELLLRGGELLRGADENTLAAAVG